MNHISEKAGHWCRASKIEKICTFFVVYIRRSMFVYMSFMLLFRAHQNCIRAHVYAISAPYTSVYECAQLALQILEITMCNV